MTPTPVSLPRRIGSRIRLRRQELGLSVRALAELSGLSARFLSDVETGKANIAVSRLAAIASALGLSLSALVEPSRGGPRQAIDRLLEGCSDQDLARVLDLIELTLRRRRPRVVALMGIRGAGKSTVGEGLAAELELPFVELDQRIEAQAGMPLGDIFSLHGEAYYRSLELRCLSDLVSAGEACVVALPGGVVASDAARTLIRDACASVWLRASPQVYWDRLFASGDTRPMTGREDAMAELVALVERRAPLYAEADLTIDTTGVDPERVVLDVLAALDAADRRP